MGETIAAYYLHGEVECARCGTRVDLSDADDIDAAIKLWNSHIADCPGSNQ
jgi:uncharacterized protein (DUF983 family)